MAQYAFSLPLPADYSADNFLVSDCNKEAWEWTSAWPKWPANALLLYGPQGSGKTHLAHIWAALAEATIITSAEPLPAAEEITCNTVIESIETRDAESLFHWLNYSKEKNHFLLLTANAAAALLPFTLPDLTSRLLALPAASIALPDDAALTGVIRKLFADRQVKVGDEVITYLATRTERSFAAAHALVAALDQEALEGRKPLTIPFVKSLGY